MDHDPLLSLWTISLAFDVGRYIVAAGAAYALFWIWGRDRFRHRLIKGRFPEAHHLHRELRYSASTLVIFSLIGTGIALGTSAGVFRIYDDVAARGWAYFAFTLVLLPILHDAYFYWTHRAMHHRLLYRRFHRVHHLSTNPSPWAAYAFAPGEAVVNGAFVPLVTLVLPVHVIAVFVFLAFMILRNVMGHLGLELLPRGFARHRWLVWSTTTTHHGLHHGRVASNFGLYFTWWDRAMGTTDPAYLETFDRITAANPATPLVSADPHIFGPKPARTSTTK
jgi:sterol desaturase/sphingolipid hydroxylase (fatty acid hydroxylase superfamily)